MSHPEMEVVIRAPHKDDPVADGVPFPHPTDDTWRHTCVAVADGCCVGVASLNLSLATDAYFCEVTVAPPYRRRRIGSQLYAAVHKTIAQPFPVLARAMSSQPLRRQFADSIGCSVLMHCPEPWINPTSTAGQRWIEDQHELLLPDQTLTAMRDLPADRVGEAWAQYFEWCHQPFGVVRSNRLPQLWSQMISGRDADASMLSIDHRTGDITALSLVTPDVWDGRTMIIAETVNETQPHGERLLHSTLAASLRVLSHRGFQRVELEGHTTDAHFPALVRGLPPGGSDPMDILVLTPPS